MQPSSPLARPSAALSVGAVWVPRPRITEAGMAFLLSVLLYGAVAWFLVFLIGSVHGDAWSRVGNASYVFLSRDPHLAAIGFVWNPLPSVAVMPFLPFRGLWPELVTHGFAANLVSVAAMAGCVTIMLSAMRDLGIPFALRVALTATFAVHPMTVYYAANGMSEGLFLLLLLWAVLRLQRWLGTQNSTELVWAGAALGLAYLTRYEAVGAAVTATAVVAVVSLLRAQGPIRMRASIGAADAVILAFPVAAAFFGWAVASWVIMGSPFETFTSLYGNASQVALGAEGIRSSTGQGTAMADDYIANQIIGIALALPIVGALAVFTAALGRRMEVLGAVAILAGVLVFAGAAFLTGRSFGWLRFSITAVPLTVLLAGCAIFGLRSWLSGRARSLQVGATSLVGVGVVIVLAAQGGSALRPMVDPALGREEIQATTAALGAPVRANLDAAEMRLAGRAAASYLDGLGLEEGEVLVDAAQGFPVILQSREPRQFVITPDRDFEAILADPAIHGVRYLLVPGSVQLDALSQRYPGIYDHGAGFGPLVNEFVAGSHRWRIYEVSEVVEQLR